MKIHGTKEVSPIELEPKAAKAAAPKNAPAALGDDAVQVSDAARALSEGSAAAPTAKQLEAIRNEIKGGTYKIDNGKIVDGILSDLTKGASRG